MSSVGGRRIVRCDSSSEPELRPDLRTVFTDRVCRAAAAAGLAWLALYAVLTALGSRSPALAQFVSDGLFLVPIAATVGLSMLAIRRVRGPNARMWPLLALSYTAQLIGESIWTGYSYLTPDGAPEPSVADVFYMSATLFMVPAVLIGFGGAGILRHLRGVLDAGLIITALGALGWKFLIAPQLTGEPDLGVLVNAAYPLLDVVLLACLVAVGMAGHRTVPRSVLLIGFSVAATTLSDIGFTYLVVIHEAADERWSNLGWQASALLSCLAALVAIRHRESAASPRALDRDLTLLPVLVSALSTFALVIVDKVHTGNVPAGTLLVAAVMLAGLLVRQYLFATDRSRLAKQLQQAVVVQERLAVTDELTGLYNRRFLLDMLQLEADRVTHSHHPLSLLIVDLDHFKRINDTFGHPVGDAVLVKAADRIRQIARATDIVARYGGEEFVILFPETSTEQAWELAERIRRELGQTPIAVPGYELTVTGSIGVATAVGDPATGRIDPDQLVGDADRALYRAKASGRDCTEIAGGPMQPSAPETIELPAALLLIADRIDACLSDEEHSTAVQRWCLLLAHRLGLDTAGANRAAAAGRVHDIGKASVEDYILSKAEPLTADEWAQLLDHSMQGARLLHDLGRFQELAPIVEAHHERYDGTGYPRGLAGAAIPIEARIIAVCDSWAAMRVDRAYAPGLPVVQARREIDQGRGTQFDPLVVDAFLALLDAGLIDDPLPLLTVHGAPPEPAAVG